MRVVAPRCANWHGLEAFCDRIDLIAPLLGRGSGGSVLSVKLALGRLVDGCRGLGSAVEKDLHRRS